MVAPPEDWVLYEPSVHIINFFWCVIHSHNISLLMILKFSIHIFHIVVWSWWILRMFLLLSIFFDVKHLCWVLECCWWYFGYRWWIFVEICGVELAITCDCCSILFCDDRCFDDIFIYSMYHVCCWWYIILESGVACNQRYQPFAYFIFVKKVCCFRYT